MCREQEQEQEQEHGQWDAQHPTMEVERMHSFVHDLCNGFLKLKQERPSVSTRVGELCPGDLALPASTFESPKTFRFSFFFVPFLSSCCTALKRPDVAVAK